MCPSITVIGKKKKENLYSSNLFVCKYKVPKGHSRQYCFVSFSIVN